jgi:hypothetical protein
MRGVLCAAVVCCFCFSVTSIMGGGKIAPHRGYTQDKKPKAPAEPDRSLKISADNSAVNAGSSIGVTVRGGTPPYTVVSEKPASLSIEKESDTKWKATGIKGTGRNVTVSAKIVATDKEGKTASTLVTVISFNMVSPLPTGGSQKSSKK